MFLVPVPVINENSMYVVDDFAFFNTMKEKHVLWSLVKTVMAGVTGCPAKMHCSDIYMKKIQWL